MPRLVSWLFVPGAAERFMAKLADARPDVAVLDLEDGLEPAKLPEARERVANVLSGSTSPAARLAVRTHAVSSPEFNEDIKTLGPALFALLIPKVAAAVEVQEAAEALSKLGLDNALLVPMIESAVGVMNAFEILTAHPAVRGVAFGGEDLAADLGLPFGVSGNTSSATEGRQAVMDAASAAVILAAAAAGVTVRIDSPSIELADFSAVKAGSTRSRAMGFSGKFAIHPNQLAHVRSGFSPTRWEVEKAEGVLVASTSGGARRSGGQMVDEAVVRQARRVIEDDQG